MKNERNDFWHDLGVGLTWASAIYLFCCFLGWLMKRRATAWIAVTIAMLFPVGLFVVLGLGFMLDASGCFPTTSEGYSALASWEMTIILVISVALGIFFTVPCPQLDAWLEKQKPRSTNRAGLTERRLKRISR